MYDTYHMFYDECVCNKTSGCDEQHCMVACFIRFTEGFRKCLQQRMLVVNCVAAKSLACLNA